MRFCYFIVLSLCFVLYSFAVKASDLVLDKHGTVYELKGFGLMHLNYDNHLFDSNAIRDNRNWVEAHSLKQKPQIHNYSKWLKLEVENQSDLENWYLSFGYARLPLFRIYEIEDISLKLKFELNGNDTFYDRPIYDPQLYIPINLNLNRKQTLLIEYRTFANAPANIRLHSYKHYLATSQKSTLINGAIAGIVMAILLIISVNLFFNPNRTNIFYALWTFTFLMIVLDMSGFTSKYFWPMLGGESSLFSTLLMTSVPIFHLLFIKSFLQLKQFNSVLCKIYTYLLYAYLVLIPVSLWFNTVFFNLVLSTLIIPLFLYTAYWSWYQKAPGIRVFSLSLFNHVLFVNVLTIVGASYGNIFPSLEISDYIKIGYLLEVSLFTVALAIQNKSVQNQLVTYLETQVDVLNQNLHKEKLQQESSIEAVKQKEEKLFADLSHELRTPLTVMKVQVESLQHNIVDNVHTSYGKLMNKIDELNSFIDHLMQVSPNVQSLKVKQYTVKDLLAHIQSINVDKTKLSLALPDEKALPAKQMELVLEYDQQGLITVFNECCDNAIAHGGSQMNISINIDNESDALSINIDNSGEAISSDLFKDIFNPLVRLDEARQNSSKHKGVGLSLCKQIIEANLGNIFASNGPLGGLSVHIVLPLKV
ncbi:histidine kinase [Pseudoalteromonas phenolica]|uniref:histidine kinase n=1 Tax=Pseudoalteromonas phenolica TaxID=161398 RepID=A0A5R9Q5H3_9GAMM|nr:histidine kinase [Pseudoalteromonas phenolica]